MRKITIVCLHERSGIFIKRQLDTLFGNLAEVDYIFINEREPVPFPFIDADMVLVSNATLMEPISRYIRRQADVIVMKFTIGKSAWKQVMDIPAGTRVLVVNDQYQSTDETLTLIHELGASHLDLVAYHPGEPVPENMPDLVVTPNEVDLVPPGAKRIINVGDRVVDGQTLIDILSKMDLFNAVTIRQVISLIEDTIPISPKLFGTLYSVMENQHHTELVLEVIGEGIITYDGVGNILVMNEYARRVFQAAARDLKGLPLGEFFSGGLAEIIATDRAEELTYTLNGRKFVVSKYPLHLDGHFMGGVIRLREHTEIERLEQKIRREAAGHGYSAKYTFDSIIGQGRAIGTAKKLAAKMAAGDGAILIEGDSGVGKELFAQAVHNASPRRGKPFVAFNCAAVPDTLIESELFGYEDGAFTGARRGGKPGLFEIAHQGTIFLDEIGDLPQGLQAKLLRVLQEREVARVGGNTVKSIDIRVLAASNRDLEELVRQGLFRKDLYYRINTLQLILPPLAERPEDILPLLEHFFEEYGVKREIGEAAQAALLAHAWPGNVRELQNCATFIVNMSDRPVVGLDDLPPAVTRPVRPREADRPGAAGGADETAAILGVIDRSRRAGKAIGRGEITRQLKAGGLFLTELEVRGRLRRLAEQGFVQAGRGRAGVRLTGKGEAALVAGQY